MFTLRSHARTVSVVSAARQSSLVFKKLPTLQRWKGNIDDQNCTEQQRQNVRFRREDPPSNWCAGEWHHSEYMWRPKLPDLHFTLPDTSLVMCVSSLTSTPADQVEVATASTVVDDICLIWDWSTKNPSQAAAYELELDDDDCMAQKSSSSLPSTPSQIKEQGAAGGRGRGKSVQVQYRTEPTPTKGGLHLSTYNF